MNEIINSRNSYAVNDVDFSQSKQPINHLLLKCSKVTNNRQTIHCEPDSKAYQH